MVENEENTQNTEDTQTDNTTDNTTNNSGCIYDKYGRTPNKDMICAIGIKSAAADTQTGVVKCVFKNKCAHCGQPALMWGWKWDNDPEKVAKFDGTDGTAEGHIYCVQSEGGCDADYSIEGNEHINGSTAKLTVVSGPTPSSEEEAQKLSNGQLACDGSSAPSSTGTVGGSATIIPDKTFYGLIKQMMGAIDGTFIIANNMAFLLSFKQLYEYRDKFEDHIVEIKPSEIIADSIIRNWSTDGFYNAVEVTYSEGIIRMQYDALVDIYGENVYYYEFPEDDEETAKAKADALLSAHVRDYSLDLQLNCLYNPNITVGAWVKIPKTLTKVSGATSKTSGELSEAKKNAKKVRKGVNITNLNEVIQEVNEKQKTFQHITTEEGEKYDIEIEKKDYEIYFVQGYKVRWTPKQSPIMSLHLKYGPDTPEDPSAATVGASSGGSSSSSSGIAATGELGDMVKQWIQGKNDDLSKAQAIHEGLKAYGIVYAYYNNFHCNSIDECLKNSKSPGLNCGDTSQLTTAAMKMGGLNAYFVLRCDSAHYFTVIEINGQKYYSDLTWAEGAKSQRPWNEVWEGNTCGNKYTNCPTC